MSKQAFEGILKGLEEALAHTPGRWGCRGARRPRGRETGRHQDRPQESWTEPRCLCSHLWPKSGNTAKVGKR
jgi:hypothetical protein